MQSAWDEGKHHRRKRNGDGIFICDRTTPISGVKVKGGTNGGLTASIKAGCSSNGPLMATTITMHLNTSYIY